MSNNIGRCKENLFIESRCIAVPNAETKKVDPDGLGVLVAEVVPKHSCLIFCATKKNCEIVSQIVIRQLSMVDIQYKIAEKRTLCKLLQVCFPILCVDLTLKFSAKFTATER